MDERAAMVGTVKIVMSVHESIECQGKDGAKILEQEPILESYRP